MTVPEQTKTNRLKDIMLFGVITSITAVPLSLIMGMKARRNPSQRRRYLRTMVFATILPVSLVAVGGYYGERNYRFLINKYFGQLSDSDLDNFETYYHLLKGNVMAQTYAPQHYPV